MVSRVIKVAVNEGYIKLTDENAVVKMRRCIPYTGHKFSLTGRW